MNKYEERSTQSIIPLVGKLTQVPVLVLFLYADLRSVQYR